MGSEEGEKKMEMTVVQGNIVCQADCDAIVNPANQKLRGKSLKRLGLASLAAFA